MEVQTIQKYIHTTPRKLRLVADMVREMEPNRALVTLRFTQKAAAVDLSKAIQTALAGARQKGMDQVEFKSVEVNEGPRLKRFRAGTKGRVKRYQKRMAHIKIVLSDDLKVKMQNSKVKNAGQNLKVETVASNVIASETKQSQNKKEIATPASSVRNDGAKKKAARKAGK